MKGLRVLASLFATFAAAPAWASPSAKLVYVRGAGTAACPGEAELRDAVRQRLGFDPFFAVADKTVIVEIARVREKYRAKMRIVRDGGELVGERDIGVDGDDCRELVEALGLVVSLALDDLEAVSPPREPEPPPTPPPAPPPSPPPPLSPAPTPLPPAPTPAPDPVTFGLAIGPTVSLGTAPAVAFGGDLSGTLARGSIGARLDLRVDAPAEATFDVPVPTAGRVSTSLMMASLAGCARLPRAWACGGAGLGRVASQTSGIARPANDAAPLVRLELRAGTDLPLGARVFVSPYLEGALALVRHTVAVDGVTVYRIPLFSGGLGIQLGARIF